MTGTGNTSVVPSGMKRRIEKADASKKQKLVVKEAKKRVFFPMQPIRIPS